MFKNVMAYKMADPNTITAFFQTAFDLADILKDHETVPPHVTAWRRYGFASSEMFGEQSMHFDGAMGARVFSICLQERLLPGRVIQQELAKKVVRLAELNGRPPHRKEIAELKDHVVAELLPKAFVKASFFYVMAYKDWLFVESGSAKTGDEICSFLRSTIGAEHGLHLIPLSGTNPQAWLKQVAKDQQGDTGPAMLFNHLESAVLKSKAEGIVRLKDVDFENDDVFEVFNGGRAVVELAMGWKAEFNPERSHDIQFAINDNLMVKRLKFSDILTQQANDESGDESKVAWFDATVAIVANRLHRLIEDLATVNEFKWTLEAESNVAEAALSDSDETSEDELYEEGVELIRAAGICSVSKLQRGLRIGYNRACRMVEDMEQRGVVSAADEKGYRHILSVSGSTAEEDDEL